MKEQSEKSKVLFYRRLVREGAGGNGGNLKLRDCFDHVLHSKHFVPRIYFSKDTIWRKQAGNYWSSLRKEALKEWELDPGDVLFFSGSDWLALPESQRQRPPVPILNIVQPRHTRPQDKRQAFLQHPAIRIAKSKHGADILQKHGVNGPLFIIPDTIDLNVLPELPAQKDIDVLVLGLKQPAFAQQVYERLLDWNKASGQDLKIDIQLPPKLPTRADFLHLLSRAKVVACVPLEAERGAEGFYLPALEAMALQCLVACPHAVGNLDHCLDGINCVVPAFTPKGLFEGVCKLLAMEKAEQERLLEAGLATAEKHRIENERVAILDLVDRAHELWQQSELFDDPAQKKPAPAFSRTIKKFFNRFK